MNDLAEFLLARYAEDEAVAKSAAPGPWRVARSEDGRYAEVVSPANSLTDVVVLGADGEFCGDLWLAADEADLAHVVRWNPPRVLAECEAKRRIVEFMVNEVKDARRRPGWTMPDEQIDEKGRAYRTGVENQKAKQLPDALDRTDRLLRLLALPYADHPAYRPEWRP